MLSFSKIVNSSVIFVLLFNLKLFGINKKERVMAMSNNVIKHDFKNYKKSSTARSKRRLRFMALVGTVLMISGIIGSIVFYL